MLVRCHSHPSPAANFPPFEVFYHEHAVESEKLGSRPVLVWYAVSMGRFCQPQLKRAGENTHTQEKKKNKKEKQCPWKTLFSTLKEMKPFAEISSHPTQGDGTPDPPPRGQALGHFLRDLCGQHLKVAALP